MHMLTLLNSQERTLADWKAMMQKADHRLGNFASGSLFSARFCVSY